MSTLLWVIIRRDATPERVRDYPGWAPWHEIVEATDQRETVCGHDVPQLGPDTEWRFRDELPIPGRACDNCTTTGARRQDAGDQPDGESPGTEFVGIPV